MERTICSSKTNRWFNTEEARAYVAAKKEEGYKALPTDKGMLLTKGNDNENLIDYGCEDY